MSFLTTITSALKGGGGARVPIARGFVSPWAAAFESGPAHRPFDYDAALRQGFVRNPVAQRSVRIVAEGVGSAPLTDTDPRLAALVGATSAGQSLVETLAAHLLLHGNAYVQILKDGAGAPVELFALRPDRIAVVPGPDGWPAAYEYRIGARLFGRGQCRAPDAAGRRAELAIHGDDPADMDFATLKAGAARDIALAFGVPPMLLGLPGDNTYANYREANRALWRLTLLPLAGKILNGLAEGLAPWFLDTSLSVDLDRVPALAEDREKLWAQVSAADFLTDREKRALLGLE